MIRKVALKTGGYLYADSRLLIKKGTCEVGENMSDLKRCIPGNGLT